MTHREDRPYEFTQRRWSCENGGRDWSDAATNRGMLRTTRSHQRLESYKIRILP